MVARAADADRRRRWATSTRRDLARRDRGGSLRERFDLIFVHCSSVAHVRRRTCATCRRSSTSATWTRRSGSSTRATSRSRLSARLPARRREARARGEAARAAVRPVHRHDARRVGDAGGLRHRRADRLVPERRRQRLLRAGRRALRPRHDLLRRAHGLLPEPGVHVRLLRAHAAAAARGAGPDSSSTSSAPIRRRRCASSASCRASR